MCYKYSGVTFSCTVYSEHLTCVGQNMQPFTGNGNVSNSNLSIEVDFNTTTNVEMIDTKCFAPVKRHHLKPRSRVSMHGLVLSVAFQMPNAWCYI